jgi:hypothetical protein
VGIVVAACHFATLGNAATKGTKHVKGAAMTTNAKRTQRDSIIFGLFLRAGGLIVPAIRSMVIAGRGAATLLGVIEATLVLIGWMF